MRSKLLFILAGWLLLGIGPAISQSLNLPPRAPGALTGTQFASFITPMPSPPAAERENWIYAQVMSGNIPDFLRTLAPVTVSAQINGINHTATYYVTPDYLAIGSDADYFLEPGTPLLAQRLCDALGCTLPTRKMVNQIWTQAAVKLAPKTIPPSAEMTTVPVFAEHNYMVYTQRCASTNSFPLGALVSGNKKDVVISSKIYAKLQAGVPKPVVIYGWHRLDGTPIQPLYNGHEESYADYSHGIRLVQNVMLVDGIPTTVSSVLTNPSLAALLSDEGPAEGTTSTGVIQVPRYSPAPRAPVIMAPPRAQTVLPGASPVFRLLAAGDAPLRYSWRFNGAPLPGATQATLALSNVQAAQAGFYAVVVSNLSGVVTSRPARLRVNTNVHPALFADSLDGNTSAHWDLYWGAGNGVADYTANWAADYGGTAYTFNGFTNIIPPAPNSADDGARALKFTVNNNDATEAIAAVNLYPRGRLFSNNFALKFDLWLNYPGGAGGAGSTGSTEFAIFGLNHLGTQANWAPASVASSDGVWFAMDGEGGVNTDYRAYVGNLSGGPTDLTVAGASGLTASNSIAAIYQNLFPAARFESAGAPGKNWVEVELRQTQGILEWRLDGTLIAQRTNTSAFTQGNIMIGYLDPYTSIAKPAKDAFALFANLRVEDLSTPALTPPIIASPPGSQAVGAGGSATFTVTAAGSPPFAYQWRRDGTNLPGATGSSFTLANVQPADGGLYDVLVSNPAGHAASAPAVLTVAAPEVQFLSASVLTNGQVQLIFSGLPGQSYLIYASTNLVNWTPISVLAVSGGPLPFIDPEAADYPARFYRACAASTQMLADFEAYAPGTQVMFQPPTSSGSTSGFLDSAPNKVSITNAFPAGHASDRTLAVAWSFKAGAVNPWLRLTTFNAPHLPNPTIGTNQVLQFEIYADRALYVGVGFRETSTTAAIGADGGSSGPIEWVGGITDNTVTPPKGHIVPAGQWTTLSFFLPYEPARSFYLGDGVLTSTTGKGVFEHLEFVPGGGLGTYNVWLDNFRVTDLGP